MSKLTWIEGESASWEDVEMTNERHQKRFGCLELIYGEDNEVSGFVKLEDNGDINTYRIGNSEREVILKIINSYIYEASNYSYDDALAEAHGFSKEEKTLEISNATELLEEVKSFILISELPSTIKVEDYEEFQDALDVYFEELRNDTKT